VLEQRILREQLPDENQRRYLEFIKGWLAPRYAEFIGKEIQTAYLESYSEYGQNIFDRYVTFADYWIQDEDYRDPETGEIFDRNALNAELEKIEKPRAEQGAESALDQLRETARSHRKADVLQHRRTVAGHFLQRQGFGGRQAEA
jgi:predicted Ser/Thr protein kinase